ncbi:MAG: glycoside hydrolase family 88 protein [Bryobacteraceae bacterium]|nr:glycoside hydrolase family 88 protein [Bryobacteraceae bacterium]
MASFLRILVVFICVACLLPGADPHAARWRSVADRLIQTPVDSYPFDWGEGVQAIGLMKIHERARDERYADYVEKWAGLFLPRDVNELLNAGPAAKGGRSGYCGHWSPATAILYLYQARGKPEHLALAEKVNDFIREGAERSPEGGLGHWQGSNQYWVDTLYMACPLLAGLGKLQRKPEYVEDAGNQIVVFARHLQEPKTGLFYHMWDWSKRERTNEPWARGNGWVIMSLADSFEAMDRGHRLYADLKNIAERLAKGLQASQQKDGLWRTVMDDPESYPESSATSMACYGVLKLVRLGVLPRSYIPMARRAWSVVNDLYIKDGVVTGVSAGTGPQGSKHYRERPVGTFTWGTGAYLLAGSEIDRLE